jgi:predicted nucleic acid-binding protein
VAVETGWGVRVAVGHVRAAVRSLGLLGKGEQAVLTLALRYPGALVVLDDDQARKAAKHLRLPTIGTLGVLVRAKREGRIPALVPLFHSVQAAGLYVDDQLFRQLATAEGENWP